MARFLAKVVLLVAVVLPAQAGIGWWLERRPLPRRDLLDHCLTERADLIVFGDSVSIHVANADRDRRTLPEMLKDELRGRRVEAVTAEGSPMELYEASIGYLARSGKGPRRVLVPVNLRSFSHEWDTRPEYQFRSDRLRLRWGDVLALGFQTPLSVWRIYPLIPLTHEQYFALPVEVGGRRVAVVRDLLDGHRSIPGWGQIPSQFAFRYLYALAPHHRKLESMVRIVSWCRAAGVDPIFYVTPIDASGGEAALGPMFEEQLGRNLDTFRRRLEPLGVQLLDFSHLLGPDSFDWKPGFPNEHLNENGRLRLAEALANALGR